MRRTHHRLRSLVLTLTIAVFGTFALDAIAAVQRSGTFPGENVNDQFSIAIANVGDVDGNGYNDLLVGATLEDSGGDAAGKAYLYIGGAFLDTVPAQTYIGSIGERFGWAVAGDGDLNGDGFADIAIGAVGADPSGPFSGKVYVFFGSQNPDNNPDLVINGGAAEGRFGTSISLSGDLNGDQYDDLVIGAPRADTTGVVLVYFGGAVMDTVPDIVLRGEYSGDRFGSAVSTGGDVNNDSFADLVVGANRNSDTGVWAGKMYLYFGGSTPDTIAAFTATGEATGDGFGNVVLISPDVTGDGDDDILVSAPYFDAGVDNDVGQVYIFAGGASLDSLADGTLTGEADGDNFAAAVATTDVNADDVYDIVVGAPGYGFMEQRGKVYLHHGGLPFVNPPDFSDTGDGSFDALGTSVAGMGLFHFHPDGTHEFVAGGWNINTTGEAWLYGEPTLVTHVREGGVPKMVSVTAYPNPFSATLTVEAHFPLGGSTEVSVYDVAGRRVHVLFEGVRQQGMATFQWIPSAEDRGGLPSGVYFLRCEQAGVVVIRKVVLTK